MSRPRDTRVARFARGAAIIAATTVATVAAVLYVTIHVFTAQPSNWSVTIRFGMSCIGPTSDAALIRALQGTNVVSPAACGGILIAIALKVPDVAIVPA